MNSSPRPTVRKFNPGVLQSDDDLISQFVVRKHELATVLEVLRDNMDADSCQHVLVVAPRGQGKTMLLARAAAEIRTNDAYSGKLLPVRFMEESHEISCIGDFWLETLFYLANECTSTAPDLADELKAAHADLSNAWSDRDYSDRVRATVLVAADQLGKQLVVMVENLQDLSDDVDADFGWQLRESLQMEPAVMLLATATSRFKALEDAREPFFELFMTIPLEPLGTEECARLWQAASGEPVGPRDVRPLEILTGGSPRLLTIVAGLARHQSVRRLMEDLVALVDDHTDYFRSHLDALPKTERRAYVAAINLWRPSSTSEIAARARMNVRVASSMLGRLVARGALVVTGRDRKRRYAAAERLYCLYYKIRRERDEAGVVQTLMRFMAAFYSRDHRSDMIAKLAEEIRQDPLIRKAIIDDPDIMASAPEAAIAAATAHYDMAFAMQGRGDAEGAIQAYDEIVATYTSDDDDMLNVVLAATLNRAYMHMELGQHRQEALKCFTDIVIRYGQDERPFLARHVALALINMGSLQAGILGTWRAGLETWRALIDRFASSDDPYVRQHVADAYIKVVAMLTEHNRAEESLAICDKAVKYIEDDEILVRTHGGRMLLVMGWMQRALGRIADALESHDKLESHDELDRRFENIVGFGGLSWRRHAARERVLTYYAAEMTDQWREAFRKMYATVASEDEKELLDLHGLAVLLVGAGVPPNVLADELAADREKSRALWPLVIALRRHAGVAVRAPAEVMDVADDILREMENRGRAAS